MICLLYTSSLQISSYSSLPAEDEAILSAMGVNGDKDRLSNFILNERTRECLGEWNRWEELSRTKTLVQRAKLDVYKRQIQEPAIVLENGVARIVGEDSKSFNKFYVNGEEVSLSLIHI